MNFIRQFFYKFIRRKKHWDDLYLTKGFNQVSWYQPYPKTSINLISSLCKDKNKSIVDIGGGLSTLVNELLKLKFTSLTVLDISKNALEKAKQRLGANASYVQWIESDITQLETNRRFDIWHDRAVFHFLTKKKDIQAYVEKANHFIKPNGLLILSTFSLKGPKKCSGLPVQRYSPEGLTKIFHQRFRLLQGFEEEHLTPFQNSQNFIWCVFKKIKGSG